MKEMTGDLWEVEADCRGVTTNGVVLANGRLVMGAGVAYQARERFPGLDELLGGYVSRWGNRAFFVAKHKLLSFPTKNNWRDLSNLELIVRSAGQAVEIADKYGLRNIILPPPGCGNGGLEWRNVKKAISPILDDRFTVLI